MALRPVLDLVRQAWLSAREVDSRPHVVVRWVGFEQRVWIARPAGPVVVDRRRGAWLRVQARADDPSYGAEATVEAVIDPGVRPQDHVGLAVHAARAALDRLAARRMEREPRAGESRVVLAPGVSGVLVHEIVGHAFEADTVKRGASWITRCPAEANLASRSLTVVDDPRRGRARWRFDDDGEAPRVTPLVHEGRVVGRLHDLRSALEAGCRPTGHGRRATYRDPVRPRMGCTFIGAGPCHPDEIVARVSDGIYVRRMVAATTDTRSGRAAFRVTDADRILHGRLDRPLRPFVIEVWASRVLRQVEQIGSDVGFDTCIGTCLRDGQPMAVSVGGPTIDIGMTTVFR
jgi:TldD protein